MDQVIGYLATALASLGLGGIAVKWLHRDVDRAQAAKFAAESRLTAERAASEEVRTILEVLGEVKAERNAIYEKFQNIERRVAVLEERERHALTRAAVHEAWDQLAFQALVATNPHHPPPPPLTAGSEG